MESAYAIGASGNGFAGALPGGEQECLVESGYLESADAIGAFGSCSAGALHGGEQECIVWDCGFAVSA